MKIKLFYKQERENLEEFERRVNDFLSRVSVIDVKYTQAFFGDLESGATILVQYKD